MANFRLAWSFPPSVLFAQGQICAKTAVIKIIKLSPKMLHVYSSSQLKYLLQNKQVAIISGFGTKVTHDVKRFRKLNSK
jgi:hypothetical protein